MSTLTPHPASQTGGVPRASTPIAEISGLNIGSRPASRKKTREIEDLR